MAFPPVVPVALLCAVGLSSCRSAEMAVDQTLAGSTAALGAALLLFDPSASDLEPWRRAACRREARPWRSRS